MFLRITKADFDDGNPGVEDEPWVPKVTNLTEGCIIRFSDGEIALAWLPDALDEFYRGVEDHQPLEPLCVHWDKEYDAVYPAHDSRNKDRRHPNEGYEEGQKKFYNDQGINCGTYHHRIQPAQGHANDPTWHQSGPWCQSVTEDSKGGLQGNSKAAERVAALKVIETRLVPVEDAPSAIYKAAAPETFAAAKKHRQFLVREKTGLEELSPDQCTSTFVLVKNRSVGPHKDKGDQGIFGTCSHDRRRYHDNQ